MRRHLLAIAIAALSIAGPAVVADTGRLPVAPFATLPADVRHPESLDVDPATGEVYVGTFDARMPESARNNQVLRFAADGRLLAQRHFGPTPLTGVSFHDGQVYVLNFGASKLQRLPARFDADSAIEDVATFAALSPPAPPARRIDNPDGSHDTITFGSQGFSAINGLVFDRAGTLYISDSFQGAVYRIANAATCRPCKVDVFARDPLLATTGALPFGANGMASTPTSPCSTSTTPATAASCASACLTAPSRYWPTASTVPTGCCSTKACCGYPPTRSTRWWHWMSAAASAIVPATSSAWMGRVRRVACCFLRPAPCRAAA